MGQRIRRLLPELGLYGLWAVLSAIMVLVAFQVHATLVFLGLAMVQHPTLRPPGWNTHTVHGLGRFLTLVLGAAWLFSVALLQDYLRDALKEKKLKARILRVAFVLGSIYLFCVGLLYFLS